MNRRTPITFVSLVGAGLLVAAINISGKGAWAEDSAPVTNKRFELVADAKSPPPEEPIYEVDPGERPGYIWNKGFWGWNGKRHVWQPGHWIKERPGYVWVCDTWAQRGTRWRLYPGHWEADNADDNETDDAVSEPVAEVTHEPSPVSPVVPKPSNGKNLLHAGKPRRGPNYHDTRQWPRIVHH